MPISFDYSIAYADKVTKAPAKAELAEIRTSAGLIKIQMEPSRAPFTVGQFLKVAKSGFYSKKVFHRAIPEFLIQGGGYNLKLVNLAIADSESGQKRGLIRIKNESFGGLKNTRGTLGMARTNDPESAVAQFYINLKDNPSLDASGSKDKNLGYTVFAKVTEGMDVVDKIAAVYTVRMGAFLDVPKVPVVIEDVKILESK